MSNVEVVNSHTFEEKETKKENKYKTQLTFVPFGKFAKIPLDDLVKITELKNGKLVYVGVSYLKWLDKQSWIKEELKTAIKPYI